MLKFTKQTRRKISYILLKNCLDVMAENGYAITLKGETDQLYWDDFDFVNDVDLESAYQSDVNVSGGKL